MHTIRIGAVLFAAAALMGCENKAKPAATGNAGGAGGSQVAPKPTGDMKADPVAKAPDPIPAQPRPDPTPGADVRPPTAADLAEYVKDLPGSGSKLLAKIDTSLGTLNCELFPDKAPMTVANFIGLATGKKPWLNPKKGAVERGAPYFDGLTFHRVIPGFMIQGGDPLGVGTGGPGYNFDDEPWEGNSIEPGILAMANAGVRGGKGTNGSQFFVMEGSSPNLNGKHTAFGKCKEVDVVKKITGVPRDPNDKPNEPVTITKVTISKG